MPINQEKLDMFNFLRRLSDLLILVNDKEYKFTTEEFYACCEEKTLLDVLLDFEISVPALETNQKKFLELLRDEVDNTKNFEDGRCALIYYVWRFLIEYIDKTLFWEIDNNQSINYIL